MANYNATSTDPNVREQSRAPSPIPRPRGKEKKRHATTPTPAVLPTPASVVLPKPSPSPSPSPSPTPSPTPSPSPAPSPSPTNKSTDTNTDTETDTEAGAYARFLSREWREVASQMPAFRGSVARIALNIIDATMNSTSARKWRNFDRSGFARRLRELEAISATAAGIISGRTSEDGNKIPPTSTQLTQHVLFNASSQSSASVENRRFSNVMKDIHVAVEMLQTQFIGTVSNDVRRKWFETNPDPEFAFFLLHDVILAQFNVNAIVSSRLDTTIETRRYLVRNPQLDFAPRVGAGENYGNYVTRLNENMKTIDSIKLGRGLATFVRESLAHNTYWVAERFNEARPQTRRAFVDGVRGYTLPVVSPIGEESSPTPSTTPCTPRQILRDVNTPLTGGIVNEDWATNNIMRMLKSVVHSICGLPPDYSPDNPVHYLDKDDNRELSALGKRITLAQIITGIGLQPATFFGAAAGRLPWLLHRSGRTSIKHGPQMKPDDSGDSDFDNDDDNAMILDMPYTIGSDGVIHLAGKENNSATNGSGRVASHVIAKCNQVIKVIEDGMYEKYQSQSDPTKFVDAIREVFDILSLGSWGGDLKGQWPETPAPGFVDLEEYASDGVWFMHELRAWYDDIATDLLADAPADGSGRIHQYLESVLPDAIDMTEAHRIISNILAMVSQFPVLMAAKGSERFLAESHGQSPLRSQAATEAMDEVISSLIYVDLVSMVLAQGAGPGGNPAEEEDDEYDAEAVLAYQVAIAHFMAGVEKTMPAWLWQLRTTMYYVLHAGGWGLMDFTMDTFSPRVAPEPSNILLRLDIAQIMTRACVFATILMAHERNISQWDVVNKLPKGDKFLQRVTNFLRGRESVPDPMKLYSTFIIHSMYELFGGMTVGVTSYADVMSVFGHPHTEEMARRRIITNWKDRGIRGSLALAEYHTSTVLSHSLGVLHGHSNIGALSAIVYAMTCPAGRRYFSPELLDKWKKGGNTVLVRFLESLGLIIRKYGLDDREIVSDAGLFDWDSSGFEAGRCRTMTFHSPMPVLDADPVNRTIARIDHEIVSRKPRYIVGFDLGQVEGSENGIYKEEESETEEAVGDADVRIGPDPDTSPFPTCFFIDLAISLPVEYVHNAIALKHALRARIYLDDPGALSEMGGEF